MNVDDELLMAYADGELNHAEHAAERTRVEAVMKADPAVAARVAQHRALRRELHSTFDRVLDEPVPERLVAAARSRAASAEISGTKVKVTDLRRARAEKAAAQRALDGHAAWRIPQWAALAASVLLGAIVGLALASRDSEPVTSRDGQLIAQAGLAHALSNQLASTQKPEMPVQIGTSFRSKSGQYCRTFVRHRGDAFGGLACRHGDVWIIEVLARTSTTPGADGGYRPAASELPSAVRMAVEEQIAGDPLDASAELQALREKWQ